MRPGGGAPAVVPSMSWPKTHGNPREAAIIAHQFQPLLTVEIMETNPIPPDAPTNGVLDDPELQAALLSINPGFGDLCIRSAGEVWGKPHLSQRIKAFITIAIDVVNQGLNGPGSPFEAHIRMAIRQGATYEEIDELLLFTCVYAGFNKGAFAFGRWGEIRKKLEGAS